MEFAKRTVNFANRADGRERTVEVLARTQVRGDGAVEPSQTEKGMALTT